MAIYRSPSLYEALKREGFILPDECGDVSVDLPVDGLVRLNFSILCSVKMFGQLGRAMDYISRVQQYERLRDELRIARKECLLRAAEKYWLGFPNGSPAGSLRLLDAVTDLLMHVQYNRP